MLSSVMSLPWSAYWYIWPGPGRPAISGGLPAWSRVVSVAAMSRVLSYSTLMPVCCSKGLTTALKESASLPAQTLRTWTTPPVWPPVDWPGAQATSASSAGITATNPRLRLE